MTYDCVITNGVAGYLAHHSADTEFEAKEKAECELRKGGGDLERWHVYVSICTGTCPLSEEQEAKEP
jgi:hypothetical protein